MHGIGWAYVRYIIVVIVVKPRDGNTEQEAQIESGPSLLRTMTDRSRQVEACSRLYFRTQLFRCWSWCVSMRWGRLNSNLPSTYMYK
jgi:hypothetical protein